MAWKWDTVILDIERVGALPMVCHAGGQKLVARINTYPEQGKFVSDFGSDEPNKVHLLASDDGGMSWRPHEGDLPAGFLGAPMPDGSLLVVMGGRERPVEESRAVIASVGRNPDALAEGRDYWPVEMREELQRKGYRVFDGYSGTVMTETALECRRTYDRGKTWQVSKIEGLPHMARRIVTGFPIRLSNGTILAHGYGQWPDAPKRAYGDSGAAVYVLRSTDEGQTWTLIPVADDLHGTRDFDETDILELPSGRVVLMMRSYDQPGRSNAYLHQSVSDDGGKTWTRPTPTPMWGYPPHLILLQSGVVHCSYAHRRYPYGMRACLSHDQCETWDIENEIVIRDDALTGRTGYPQSAQLDDQTIVTAYSLERAPRVPYSPEDQVSWGSGRAVGDIVIKGWHRDPKTQASVGGCHMYAGLSRYTADYVRCPGQKSSKVMYQTEKTDFTD